MPAEENHRNGSGDPFASGDPQHFPNRFVRGAGGVPRRRRGPPRRREIHRDIQNVLNEDQLPGGDGDDNAGCNTVESFREAPPALNAPEVWEQVLSALRTELPSSIFLRLENTIGLRCANGEFQVSVGTPFDVAWLERRLYQPLCHQLKALTGQEYYIQFVVKGSSGGEPTGERLRHACEGNPCLKDHWTPEHQQGVLEYILRKWDVVDIESLAELWSFPIIEDTLRALAYFRDPYRRFNRPSHYFVVCIETVARQWGMSEDEIADKREIGRKPPTLRPRPKRDIQ